MKTSFRGPNEIVLRFRDKFKQVKVFRDETAMMAV